MEEQLQQDPIKKITPSEFAKQLKNKYPQYKDIDDTELVDKMILKYPQYKDRIDFDVKKRRNPIYFSKHRIGFGSCSGSWFFGWYRKER